MLDRENAKNWTTKGWTAKYAKKLDHESAKGGTTSGAN